jgi:hypothetical protein
LLCWQDCEFPHRGDYYPGQTLWGPLHGLEQATWLHCTKELKAVRSNAAKSCKTVKVRQTVYALLYMFVRLAFIDLLN